MGINTQAKAADISLNFNSLPTEQGWDVFSASSSPNSLFSVDGTVLKQNTMGIGRLFSAFQINNVVDIDESFTLSFTARVLNDETTLSRYNPFGFGVFVTTGTQAFAIGLGLNDIGIGPLSEISSPVNNSQFYDYRLEGYFLTGEADLYIDNTLVTTVSSFGNSNNNSLIIGDTTRIRNAQVELKSFTFTQGSHAVPEPLTILGKGVSIGFGSFFKHQLNKKKFYFFLCIRLTFLLQ